MNMEEVKSGNKKLLLAFLMLILTAIALTTASYAWFSANANITLGSLDVYVQSSSGIQISMDASEWNSSLTTEQIWDAKYANSSNQFAKIMTPVSTGGEDADDDGFIDMFLGVLSDDGSTVTLSKDSETQTSASTADNARGNYIAFDLFIQSTSQQNIYLQSTSTVYAANVNSLYGTGDEGITDKGLKSSVRVGFLNKGAQADYDEDLALTLNGTSQDGQVGVGDFKIWEPNANLHTKVATNNGASGVIASYKGAVLATSGTGVSLDDETHFKDVTTIKSNYTDSPTAGVIGVVGSDYVFQLNPGINKIRVYIWVEGQDVDCENTASTGSGVSVSLYLTAK